MSKEYNESVKMFLITVFLGWLGVHKFMQGKVTMGLIYMFTYGLCLVGWIIDVKNSAKDMSNASIIYGNINRNSNLTLNNKLENTSSIREYHFDYSDFDEDYILKYEYSKKIAGSDHQDLDFNSLKNGSITFKCEPDNEFDKNAIAIFKDGIKLGYVYKNDDMINEMIHKYQTCEDWKVEGYLSLINDEEKKIGYQIAFYKKVDEDDAFKTINASLTKTSKKDEMSGLSRQDNLSCMGEDDFVQIDSQIDSDCLLVLNESYEELGELSESISEQLNEYIDEEGYAILAKIKEVTENDSGKYGAKLKILIYKK